MNGSDAYGKGLRSLERIRRPCATIFDKLVQSGKGLDSPSVDDFKSFLAKTVDLVEEVAAESASVSRIENVDRCDKLLILGRQKESPDLGAFISSGISTLVTLAYASPLSEAFPHLERAFHLIESTANSSPIEEKRVPWLRSLASGAHSVGYKYIKESDWRNGETVVRKSIEWSELALELMQAKAKASGVGGEGDVEDEEMDRLRSQLAMRYSALANCLVKLDTTRTVSISLQQALRQELIYAHQSKKTTLEPFMKSLFSQPKSVYTSLEALSPISTLFENSPVKFAIHNIFCHVSEPSTLMDFVETFKWMADDAGSRVSPLAVGAIGERILDLFKYEIGDVALGLIRDIGDLVFEIYNVERFPIRRLRLVLFRFGSE